MGGGKWNTNAWSSYKTTKGISSSSSVNDIFTSYTMKESLNPLNIKIRESCDSLEHPNSTPIIMGLDITGSMGFLAEEIAKNGLNQVILNIYDKKPVSDPQIMIMAIGDMFSDSAPLQVTQFESDIRIAEQLTDIYFEGYGGANGGESYLATWYFAARHTEIDSYNIHGKKGFLFTIGDEPNHKFLTKEQVKKFFGDDIPNDLSEKDLLDEVSEKYNVFHFVVGNGKHYDSYNKWKKMLGERVLELYDHTKIPEKITELLTLVSSQEEDNYKKKQSNLEPKDKNISLVKM